MVRPMYCPMSLMSTMKVIEGPIGGFATELAYVPKPAICTPDCAWAVKHHGIYECCISANTRIPEDYRNTRSLKDE